MYLNTCFQHSGAWLPSSTPTASSPSILKTCAAWSLMELGDECDLVLFPSRPSPPQEAFANCARTSSHRVWIPSVQHRRAARRRPSRLRQIVSRSRLWSLLDSPPSIAATLFAVPGIYEKIIIMDTDQSSVKYLFKPSFPSDRRLSPIFVALIARKYFYSTPTLG